VENCHAKKIVVYTWWICDCFNPRRKSYLITITNLKQKEQYANWMLYYGVSIALRQCSFTGIDRLGKHIQVVLDLWIAVISSKRKLCFRLAITFLKDLTITLGIWVVSVIPYCRIIHSLSSNIWLAWPSFFITMMEK